MTQTMATGLSHSLEPICPRDDRRMRYEGKGISWKAIPADQKLQSIPSYHCGYDGCSVRFDLLNGYFSVVLVPDQPYFIEEPGVNLHRCPRHGTWLYRKKTPDDNLRYDWHCGVEGCDYVHPREWSNRTTGGSDMGDRREHGNLGPAKLKDKAGWGQIVTGQGEDVDNPA